LGFTGVGVKFIKASPPAGRISPIQAAPAPSRSPQVATARSVERTGEKVLQAEPPAKLLSKEDFKNDPLIKKALEIFKGTIVEVRA
jgi:hypothetical protein